MFSYSIDMEEPEETVFFIRNIGKLTSLQNLCLFSVQRSKGFELEQLRNLKELRGDLMIICLENVTRKDKGLESILCDKRHLEGLTLCWSKKVESEADNRAHLELLEGVMLPRELKHLSLNGYKSDKYPSWLVEGSYFDGLNSFELRDCSKLEDLPPNAEVFRNCSQMFLHNVLNLKALHCIPDGLVNLYISRCPLLMLNSIDEVEQHNEKAIVMTDRLVSLFASICEPPSGPNSKYKWVLFEEHLCLKKLGPLMDTDISVHLRTIEGTLNGEGYEGSVKENFMKAWSYCNEQRMKLLYGNRNKAALVLPSTLCLLRLSSCSISDGALSICLGGLTLLKGLTLDCIMTVSTLPPEEVFQNLTSLETFHISNCWCLMSLGGLQAATSLLELMVRSCPSLGLAHAAESMPLSLLKLSIYHCRVSGRTTLLRLIDVPNLSAECISQCRVQNELYLSSSVMVSDILSVESFTISAYLNIQYYKEPSISFEKFEKLASVKYLSFVYCGIQSLPSLRSLTSLEGIRIGECPNLSCLPDMPTSLQQIIISNCKLLKEICKPNGESWPKIAHVPWKLIQ